MPQVIFLVFFSRNLVLFGPPSEIQKDRWGYLIDAGAVGAWADFVYTLPLIIFALHRAVNHKIELKKTHYLLASFFIYVFVSYRLNTFLAIFSGVYVLIILKKEFGLKDFYRIALLLCALSLFFKFYSLGGNTKYICHDGFLRNECTSVYEFIRTSTPWGAKVGTDPFYGHSVTYLSQRPVLADLYVEYADDEKYEDAILLFWENSERIIEKYNLSTVLLDNLTTEFEMSTGLTDKVYDNGVMKVYLNS